jgi:hypothetical protein
MPANRPAKPQAKRPSSPADAGPRLPLENATLRMGFRLPDWKPERATAPRGSLAYRAARTLANVIVAIGQNQIAAPPGLLTLDIETPCDPNRAEGFPSIYASDLAQHIIQSLTGVFNAGMVQAFQLPPKSFPELGEVKIGGCYTPAQEAVAPSLDSSDTGGQEAIKDTGPPVTEGSIEATPQTSPERAKPVYTELVKEFFTSIPTDPTQQFEVVTDRIDLFRQQATRKLEVAINSFLASQNPQTFEEKQSIVEIINSRFDKIGVTIHYKDQACNLIAALSGGSPTGRFHLVPRGSNVPLLARVNLSDILPIQLIDTPRRFPSRER